MNERRRLLLLVVLALCGAALSGLLLAQHHGESAAVAAVDQVCGEGQNGCDRVNQSRWAELGGVPVAGLGLVFYLALAAFFALAAQAEGELGRAAGRLGFLAVLFGLAVDAVLFGLQAFSIGAYCKLCLATYAVNAVMLALLWPWRAASPAALASSAGRLVFSGWLLASLALVAGVWAGDGWLRSRATRRAAVLLGDPAALAPAAATAPLPADSAALQARVLELQRTLDDPQRLQQYLTDKSLREFDSANVQQVSLEAPRKGEAAAPIKVVEYSDMMCPYCRSLAGAFRDYVPQTRGRVAVYFKHYPLDQSCNAGLQRTVHAGACSLALGGVCAEQQGRFWEYHDRVFAQALEKASEADTRRFAQEAGLDAQRFAACLASPQARQRLEADVVEARGLGVNSTPTLLINGRKVPNLNLFLQLVEKEAQRLGLPPLSPPQAAAR